jgi:arabinose-5-phosphate isomerase
MNALIHSLPRPSPVADSDPAALIRSGQAVIDIETRAIEALRPRIDADFVAACRLMLACQGRVVAVGMGKSGHIARKIAATFASTGTPAFYVHPGEASHGDLGMITQTPTWCWRCPTPVKPMSCSPSCRCCAARAMP